MARLRQLLENDVAWPWLLNQAGRHGLLPLLTWNLNQAAPDLVPSAILKQLQARFRANAGRNVALTRELLKLLHCLEAEGIRALPYKGPALAETVYGNLALRQFGDLDILVRPEDARQAKALMMAQGYRPKVALSPAQEKAYLRTENVFDLIRDDNKVYLELHWSLAQRYYAIPFSFEAMWQRKDNLFIMDEAVPHFSPTDLLLILCLHGTRHHWERLSWLCDVAELIRQQPIAWDRVMKLAQQKGRRNVMLLSLLLAHNILSVPVPADLVTQARTTPVVKKLAEQLCNRMFQEGDQEQGLYRIYYMAMFWFRVSERFRDKIRVYDLILSPNGRDWSYLSFPPYLSWLYYPLRAVRLFRQYGVSLIRDNI